MKGKHSNALLDIILAVALVFLLSGGFVPQIGVSRPGPIVASAQSNSSSCSSSSVLKLTEYGGVPNSFNLLTASITSSYTVAFMEYLSIYPVVAPNGYFDWNDSISDAITHNANYTQWTFHVRPGLMWSDGTNVTAQDILNTYSSQFALNPTYDFVNAHTEVVSIQKLNTSTAQFNLNASDAHFPEKISSLIYTAVYPQSVISQGANTTNFGTDIVDGPFYVANYTSGSTTLVMLRNPYYRPLPKVCEIDINFVETESQTSTYLEGGTSDFAPIVPNVASSILANPNLKILQQPGEYVTTINWNVTRYPYNMTQFRQALVYGINQSAIVQNAFAGYGSTAYNAEGGVPTFSSWYNSHQSNYSYSPSQATTLLSSIGIKMGSDGFLQYPNGTDVSLTLWADTDVTSNEIAAGIVQSSLQSLGFKVTTLEATSMGTLIGYDYHNTFNIQNNLIIHTSGGPVFGDAYLDGEPAWFVYNPYVQPAHNLYPPSIDNEYNGNKTALEGTADPALESQYLSNIQSLNSQYLPQLVLDYAPALMAYNTQRFTNWPSTYMYYIAAPEWNDTALALLTPAGSSTT